MVVVVVVVFIVDDDEDYDDGDGDGDGAGDDLTSSRVVRSNTQSGGKYDSI